MVEILQFWIFANPAAVWMWKTFKHEKQKHIFMEVGFLQQLHLQLQTNIFASSFLDDSLILHREMGPDIIVFSPFFYVFKKNATTVNIQTWFFFFISLWKAEDSSVKSNLFLSFLFLAHVGSSLLPPLLADKLSGGWMFTMTPLRGNETLSFRFTVLNMTRQSTGREGRVEGSKVTVFQQRRISHHNRTNNIHNVPPAARHHIAFAGFFFFLKGWGGGALHSFDR